MMRIISYSLLAVAIALFTAVSWISFSERGTNFAIRYLDSVVEQVSIADVRGSLAGGLKLPFVSITTDTLHAEIIGAHLAFDPFALLLMRARIYELDIDKITATLEPGSGETSDESGVRVSIPIAVHLSNVSIGEFLLDRAGTISGYHDIELALRISGDRLELDRFVVKDESLSLSVSVKLNLVPPWPMQATYLVNLKDDKLLPMPLELRGVLNGDTNRLQVNGVAKAPGQVDYRGTISSLTTTPSVDMSLNTAHFDLEPIVRRPGLLTATEFKISGSMQRYRFSGEGNLRVPEVPSAVFALEGSGDPEAVRLSPLTVALEGALISVDGTWQMQERRFTGNLDAADLPLSLASPNVNGKLDLQGSLDYQQDGLARVELGSITGTLFDRPVRGNLGWQGSGVESWTLAGELHQGENTIRIDGDRETNQFEFSLNAPDPATIYPGLEGRILANGNVMLTPEPGVDARVTAAGLPLSFIDASLAGRVDVDGDVAWARDRGFMIHIQSLQGELFEKSLSGTARLTGTDVDDVVLAGDLSLGDNRLVLDGNRLEKELAFRIDAPRLADVHPLVGGALNAYGHIKLEQTAPLMTVHADGSNLSFGNHRLNALKIDVPASDTARHEGTASWDGWHLGNTPMGSGEVHYDGTLTSGRVDLAWTHPRATSQLSVSFSRTESGIKGQLTEGRVTPAGIDTWEVSDSVSFTGSWKDPVAVSLTPHCWTSGQSSACFSELDFVGDNGSVEARLKNVPVNLDNVISVPNGNASQAISVHTTVNLDLRARLQDARLSGDFVADFPGTRFTWSEDEDPLRVDFHSRGLLSDNRLDLSIDSGDSSEHELRAEIRIPQILEPAGLVVRAGLAGEYLPFLVSLVPQISRGTGKIRADVQLDTTGPAPVIAGRLGVPEGASLVVPAAGIQISNIRLDATASEDGMVRFDGAATSGTGGVSFEGEITDAALASRTAHLAINARNFLSSNRKDLTLITSSELQVMQSESRTRVTGSVTVDSGEIRLREFGTGTRTRSPDVVLADAEPASPLPGTELDLRVAVDESVHISAFGLDTNIAGELSILQGLSSPARAHGTLTLSKGTFERYGQKLNIERGRLIFSGPLNNPNVDVVTTRTIPRANEVIKVTLTLYGPANNIQSQITSTPPMSDGNALSYLLLGRPLNTASSQEGQNLSGAALALGLKKAMPITKEIATTLGLDEFSVSAENLDSAEILAGKRLSPDLYLQYNYDVFSRIGGILLNYSLTPRLSIEAQSGEAKSLELIYSF